MNVYSLLSSKDCPQTKKKKLLKLRMKFRTKDRKVSLKWMGVKGAADFSSRNSISLGNGMTADKNASRCQFSCDITIFSICSWYFMETNRMCGTGSKNGREWLVSFTVVPSAARLLGIHRGLKRNSGC